MYWSLDKYDIHSIQFPCFQNKKMPVKIAGFWTTALELFGRVGWSMLVFHLALRVRAKRYILGSVSKLVKSLPVLYIFQTQIESTPPFGDKKVSSGFITKNNNQITVNPKVKSNLHPQFCGVLTRKRHMQCLTYIVTPHTHLRKRSKAFQGHTVLKKEQRGGIPKEFPHHVQIFPKPHYWPQLLCMVQLRKPLIAKHC